MIAVVPLAGTWIETTHLSNSLGVYVAALTVDKVQTFLTEAIHSHVQEKETEEAALRGIINLSDQISKDFFKAIYAEFSEAEENTLMKCSGVFIFSSGRSEEELRERLNSLFVKYYKASQGQKILRYVCFPSEGLDEISAIKKAKIDLKQVKSMNSVIEKNRELRNLVKAQYVDQVEEAVFAPFFNNVGVEMVKAGSVLKGELCLEDDEDFKAILKSANKATKKKVKQMLGYLEKLTKIQYKSEDFSKELSGVV